MFGHILSTFIRTILLSLLLLIAFFLAFYMAFHVPGTDFLASPFFSPAQTFLTTMTYITGEGDYNGVFGLSYDRGKVLETPPFLPVSVILWIGFLIIMVILFVNMLVRLAIVTSYPTPLLQLIEIFICFYSSVTPSLSLL